MNYIDITIIVLVCIGIVQGIRHGLVKELAIIAAIIVGIYVAQYLVKPMQSWIVDTFNINVYIAQRISYAVLFLAGSTLIHLIANLLSRLLKMIHINWINRILGGVFGFVKYIIIISFIINIVNLGDSYFNVSKTAQVRTSVFYKPVGAVVPAVLPFVDFGKAKHSLDDTMEKMTKDAARVIEKGYKRL